MRRIGRRFKALILAHIMVSLIAGCAGPTPATTLVEPTMPAPTATLTAAPTVADSPSPAPTAAAAPSPTPAPTRTLRPIPTLTPLPPTSGSPLGPWGPLPVDGLPGPWVNDVAFATPDVAFLVAAGNVYRSDDGGRTWAQSFDGTRWAQGVAASPAFAADPTVFAVDGASRLFRSDDGGASWEEVTRIAQVGGASDTDVRLFVSPGFPADPTLWAWMGEMAQAYRSPDGGSTWEQLDPGVELPWNPAGLPIPEDLPLPEPAVEGPRFLAGSGETLLLGTMRGLYRSTDGGATWSEANAGLPRSAVGPVTVADDGTLYAAVGGDPRLFRLPAEAACWQALGRLPEDDLSTGLVYSLDAADAGGQAVLGILTREGVYLSRDGGATWDAPEGQGLPPYHFHHTQLLLASDFAESGVAHLLYRRLNEAYQTLDGGDSWAEVKEMPSVSALVEAPDGRWVALASSAAYEWDPGSDVGWVRHPYGFHGVPTVVRFVTDATAVGVVDDRNSVWHGRVYLSQDGGRGWVRIGEGGSDVFDGYLISPRFEADRAIYARGASTVHVSTDAGRTWVEAGEGLPVCDVYGGPACDLVLLGAARSGAGYTVYASVRDDYHTRVWAARAGMD